MIGELEVRNGPRHRGQVPGPDVIDQVVDVVLRVLVPQIRMEDLVDPA
jgi:hypothetical protein